MTLRLPTTDGATLVVALAIASDDLTRACAACTEPGGYPCPACLTRTVLADTCDRLAVQIDDYLAELCAAESRRAASTPEEGPGHQAADHTTKPQPAGTISLTTRQSPRRPTQRHS